MNKFLVITIAVLGLALAGVITFGFVTLLGERSDLKTELASLRATLTTTEQQLNERTTTLAATEIKLADTENQLNVSETNLETVNETLVSVRADLKGVETNLVSAQTELTSTKGELTDAEQRIETLDQDLSETTKQLRMANQTLAGLDISISLSKQCYDVVLLDNDAAQDPTWAEVKLFLAADKTENHEYIPYTYDCSQFSRDLHNAAEAAGIRCAEVQISFEGELIGHALNAFLTSDYGLVYVDCTGGPDTIARVEAGEAYRAVAVPNMSIINVRNDTWWNNVWNYYYIESYGGGQATVSDIRIFW